MLVMVLDPSTERPGANYRSFLLVEPPERLQAVQCPLPWHRPTDCRPPGQATPSRKNPQFCSYCGGDCPNVSRRSRGRAHPALRGRTRLDVATHVLIDSDGWIDKLMGDEVIALYLPFLEDHPARAVRAAQELMRATGQGSPAGPWIPVGIGIQTGTAFVGTVGSEDTVTDFTALRDAVNVATRLVSAAAAGEILVSNATYSGTGLMLEDLERRELALKVRTEPVGARVMR